MNRQRIEALTTPLVVLLVGVLCGLVTIGFADLFLDWDLLDPSAEKLAAFLVAAIACALFGSLAISATLNLSRIAHRL